MKRDQVRQSRRAFSLIELLIVILIIALLVAILLPALGSVRGKSRDASTRNLMANLSQSITMFEQSEKRLPGWFSQKEMGALSNQTEGFSAMNNVLLDLAGGVVSGTPLPAGNVEVGPMANSGVHYHDDAVGKIGTNGKAYFTPPAANWKLVNGGEYGDKFSTPNNKKVKDLVDAEGMPILVWMQDPMAVGPIDQHNDMAAITATNNPLTGTSRFYRNSNHAFLAANACGKKRIDQDAESLIGVNGGGTNGVVSLAGMLGAPGSPLDVTKATPGILPSAARGSFVLQSAGRNGIYLGRNEKGAARMGTLPSLYYGLNFKDASGNALKDENGGATSSDIMKDFDDIIMAGS